MTILLKHNGDLCGVPTRMVKLAAAELHRMQSARLWDLAVVLAAPVERVRELWETLKAAECIVECDGWHRPTDSMLSLANARLGNPLTRKKADALVAQLIRNAQQLNDAPGDAFYFVTKLAVFGSYLDNERNELGDLDVAWELIQRPGFERSISSMRCVNEDPTSHMRRLVRPRSPAVRLVDWSLLLDLKCSYRIVLEMSGPKLEEAITAREVRRKAHVERAEQVNRALAASLIRSPIQAQSEAPAAPQRPAKSKRR